MVAKFNRFYNIGKFGTLMKGWIGNWYDFESL